MNLLIIFILVLLGRYNSSLLGYELLNTDEFVIAAKASRLLNEYSFYEFDGDTSGILNALFLLWPSLFNLEISYLSIRISSILAVTLILYFTFKTICINTEKKFSYLLIAPLILFFSLSKDPDFLHYTNELISILLIVISLFIYFKHYKNLTNLHLFVISFFLGSVLFAKMQFFPVACILIAFINLKILLIDKKIKQFFLASLSFIFPTIIISIYYFSNNEIEDLFYNVIYFPLSDLFARNEVTQKELIIGSNSLQTIIKSNKKITLFNHIALNSFFHLLYLYFLYFIFYSLNFIRFRSLKDYFEKVKDLKVIIISISIISTLAIILVTGSVHRHYFINLIPLVPIFISVFVYADKEIVEKKNLNNNFLLALIILFCLSLSLENKKFYSNNFIHQSFFENKISFKSPEILQYLNLKKKEDKLLVWGWKPEIYILSGLSPSNRETTNLKQIDYRPGRKYFRQRFIKEFANDNPAILLDYAKENALFYSDEKYGVKSFKQLEKKLNQNYFKINSTDKSCPDLYLLKDKYIELEKKLINFTFDKRNSEILKKINDFNIDEDLCETAVIFSNEMPDTLILHVDTSEKIKKIKILSSKINYSPENMKLIFLKENKVVNKKEIILKNNPFWNTVNFNEEFLADKIVINIKDLKEKNFGINEIKIYSK